MNAPIFLSHSSKDQKIALTICTALENRGLKCWIAPRDVGPGQNYMEAIVRAIRGAKVMVLLFTENANNSDEVLKELSLASKYKVNVIPARAEDVVPSYAFELEFATRQWIDLFTDWDREIERLSRWIADIVALEPADRSIADAGSRRPDSASTAGTPGTRASIADRPGRRKVGAFASWARRPAVAVLSIGIIVLAVFLGWYALRTNPASLGTKANQVEIDYVAPSSAQLQPVYDQLKKRQLLEGMQQFLSPLQLPRKLPLKFQQCNEANSFYNLNRDGAVIFCYELVDWIERAAPKSASSSGVTRDDAIVGPILEIMMHQVSHGILDQLQVPTLGRLEDNTDQLAAFILLQFGKDITQRVIAGTIHFLRSGNPHTGPKPELFSFTHGLWLQRLFNHTCMAYGSDILRFNDLVQASGTPEIAECPKKYEQHKQAFIKFILPHIDSGQLRKVQAREWLMPKS